MEDYEETYESFWKAIVENEDGTLNMDQLKRELHDYFVIISQVSKVYMHVTGGRISKPNTLASEVCNQADEYYENLYRKDEDY